MLEMTIRVLIHSLYLNNKPFTVNQMPEITIKVFVAFEKKSIPIKVNTDDTVDQAIGKIQQQASEFASFSNPRLYYDDKKLLSTKKLSEYEIQNDASVDIIDMKAPLSFKIKEVRTNHEFQVPKEAQGINEEEELTLRSTIEDIKILLSNQSGIFPEQIILIRPGNQKNEDELVMMDDIDTINYHNLQEDITLLWKIRVRGHPASIDDLLNKL